MDNNKKINSAVERKFLGIILITIGLLNNWFLLKKLFPSVGVIETLEARVSIWGASILFLLFGCLIFFGKIRFGLRTGNIIFSFFISILTLYSTLFADRLTGVYLGEQGLLFPPNSEIRYTTPEFDFVAAVNSLGFRDHEYPVKKKAKFRVLTIGDSFTFGWGVDIDDIWNSILEKKLQQEGIDAEVLNLGESGAHPATYVQIAETAIPLLEPDLIVVGVLQGDDLAQTIERQGKAFGLVNLDPIRIVRKTAEVMYPNLIKLVPKSDLSIQTAWRKQAKDIHSKYFNDDQKKRFESIDATVKDMFFKGQLNPSMIYDLIRTPDRMSVLKDLNKDDVKSGIDKMAEYFSAIKNAGEASGSKVIVLSIPYGYYLCKNEMKSMAKMGASIDEELLKSDTPDIALGSAATKAKLKFYSFTEMFRRLCGSTNLFYEYDGHFNKTGNQVFADAVFEAVKNEILSRN